MLGDVDWNLDVIHLQDYGLPHLPDSPTCPNLVKLFLQVPSLVVVPPAFFEHMQGLKVLDLSNTNIVSLPASISSLRLLQELFLRDCSTLMELPSEIGMLSKLKLFDMKGTELMFLPKEMGKLKDLEVLRVTLSQYAKDYIKTSINETVIPRKMISELKKLNELCVIISIGPEPEWWEEEVKYLQNELCDLENLETLVWYLPTNELLQQFLLLERSHVPIYANLSNLKLTIGQHAQLTSCLPHGLEKKFEEFKNCLKWVNAEGSMDDISKIMVSAEALFLSRHWTIEKLSTLNVTRLKYCLLAECNEMEALVDIDGLSEDVVNKINNGQKVALEMLQYLSIHHMNKLQSIWKGPTGKDSLSKLRVLALHTCLQLTLIFSPTIAQNLSCLVELTVEDCPKVTCLISSDSHNIKAVPILPSLERIFLLDLPVFVNIFVGRLENLRTMLIYSCLQLRDLSNMELPNIQRIEGEDEWWEALDCDKSPWENIFVQLKRDRDLVEQLFEATNSLQHFHDILSQENDEKKSFDLTDHRDQVITAEMPMVKGKETFFPQEDFKEQESHGLSYSEASGTQTETDAFDTLREVGPSSFIAGQENDEKESSNLTDTTEQVIADDTPIEKEGGIILQLEGHRTLGGMDPKSQDTLKSAQKAIPAVPPKIHHSISKTHRKGRKSIDPKPSEKIARLETYVKVGGGKSFERRPVRLKPGRGAIKKSIFRNVAARLTKIANKIKKIDVLKSDVEASNP